ncbi:hypothetical protein CR513_48494, partial [Mucuna pruriens]
MDQNMIYVASDGALMDKTPTVARNLISNMASNTQQFGTRGAVASRVVNEVAAIDIQRLENRITELTFPVRQLVIGQHHTSPPAKNQNSYQQLFPKYQAPPFRQQQQQQVQQPDNTPSLEELMKQLATSKDRVSVECENKQH